jgi:hypothetical protein
MRKCRDQNTFLQCAYLRFTTFTILHVFILWQNTSGYRHQKKLDSTTDDTLREIVELSDTILLTGYTYLSHSTQQSSTFWLTKNVFLSCLSIQLWQRDLGRLGVKCSST